MAWNPDVYNKFKEIRYKPFYDLLSHVDALSGNAVLDLGCGTGELTGFLADKFPGAQVLGIDSSAEMLSKAVARPGLSFAQRPIEAQLGTADRWDLIVANASLQWIADHARLFPKIISRLAPGGQLAVQMPNQAENILNQLLNDLVQEPDYYDLLHDTIHHSPVLSLDEYTQLLYANGAKEVLVYQQVYPMIADSVETLYDFISGSALIPYMSSLPESQHEDFIRRFKTKIAYRFPVAPMVYPFKRIFMVAKF